jgi:hypothetical protein
MTKGQSGLAITMPRRANDKQRVNEACGTKITRYGIIATLFEIGKDILLAPAHLSADYSKRSTMQPLQLLDGSLQR